MVFTRHYTIFPLSSLSLATSHPYPPGYPNLKLQASSFSALCVCHTYFFFPLWASALEIFLSRALSSLVLPSYSTPKTLLHLSERFLTIYSSFLSLPLEYKPYEARALTVLFTLITPGQSTRLGT